MNKKQITIIVAALAVVFIAYIIGTQSTYIKSDIKVDSTEVKVDTTEIKVDSTKK